MNCSGCGQPIAPGASFCDNCGRRLDGESKWGEGGGNTDPYAVNEQALAAFVGYSNTEKYLRAWRLAANPDSSVRWHWPAFFIGPIWYAYRKMYKWAMVIFGAEVVLSLLNLVWPKALGSLIGLGVAIACSLFAYPAYYRHAMQNIAQVKQISPDGNVYLPELQHRGGTSGGAVVVVILSYIALMIIFVVIAVLNFLHQYGNLSGLNSIGTIPS